MISGCVWLSKAEWQEGRWPMVYGLYHLAFFILFCAATQKSNLFPFLLLFGSSQHCLILLLFIKYEIVFWILWWQEITLNYGIQYNKLQYSNSSPWWSTTHTIESMTYWPEKTGEPRKENMKLGLHTQKHHADSNPSSWLNQRPAMPPSCPWVVTVASFSYHRLTAEPSEFMS